MRRITCLALILHLAVRGEAATSPEVPATRLEDSPAFASMQEAAFAGLVLVTARFADVEYGGVVVERGGRYFYTMPVTAHRGTELAFRILIPKDAHVVGMYHTHPRGRIYLGDVDALAYFSSNDIAIARSLGVVSYIAEECDHTVRMFDPSAAQNRHLEPGRRSPGVQVGKVDSLHQAVAVLPSTQEQAEPLPADAGLKAPHKPASQ